MILDSIPDHPIYDCKLSHHVIFFFLMNHYSLFLSQHCCVSLFSGPRLVPGPWQAPKLLRNECKCSCPWYYYCTFGIMCVTDCIVGPSSSPWHFINDSAVLPTTDRVCFLISSTPVEIWNVHWPVENGQDGNLLIRPRQKQALHVSAHFLPSDLTMRIWPSQPTDLRKMRHVDISKLNLLLRKSQASPGWISWIPAKLHKHEQNKCYCCVPQRFCSYLLKQW